MTPTFLRTLAPLAVLALSLTGCSTLPRSTPNVSEVLADNGRADISVIDITMDTVSGLPADFAPLPEWTISDGTVRAVGVEAGDILSITVFEIGYSLFSGNSPRTGQSASAPAGGGFEFPPLRVPDNGQISLPFAGQISVLGKTGTAIGQAFEARLRGQSQNAQVIVSVERGPRSSVIVSGDVKQSGRIALTEAGERLLDAVALASGPEARPADTVISLSRDGVTNIARLDDIAATSVANVLLNPGDSIALAKDVRTITVLGAAQSVREIAFDSAELSLSEALARAGGLNANRADPTGVFIFRQEGSPVGTPNPVIYRLNLLEPTGYFAAQNFAMRESDIMLVADAKSNQINQLLQMVNALASPVVTIDLLTR